MHNRFHISQHLNEVVDKVRRQENKALKEAGDRRLVGTKFNWLVNEENLNEVFAEQFSELKQADLKVSRAWVIKARCRGFWDHRYAGWARRHFDKWYAWAIRCRLEPIKGKARMIKDHLPHILTCFKHRISNRDYIQKYKPSRRMPEATALSMASETAFYFYCGGPDMTP